jgi:dienelactone hydrolase
MEMRSLQPIKLLILLKISFFFGCATNQKRFEKLPVNEVHERSRISSPGLLRFSTEGPFSYSRNPDLGIPLSISETLHVDFYTTLAEGKAPLIILSHGNYSGKAAHEYQARMLASWGFNVVVTELPNRAEWLSNGQRLSRLSKFLWSWPQYLGKNVDREKIILAGHSFGGSAAILALNQGAPVIGLILLDPAIVHESVKSAMKASTVPAMLLGADRKYFVSRGRSIFKKNWSKSFGELSVREATHDDAQGPSMFSRFTLGVDPFTSREKQNIFVAAMVSSAISLSTSGNLEGIQRDVEDKSMDLLLLNTWFK